MLRLDMAVLIARAEDLGDDDIAYNRRAIGGGKCALHHLEPEGTEPSLGSLWAFRNVYGCSIEGPADDGSRRLQTPPALPAHRRGSARHWRSTGAP